MQKSFDIKFIDVSISELNKIGFDKVYANYGLQKHEFVSLKICSVSVAQANILKQTAISVGTDCAVHRDVITGKVDLSDCILSGSVNELTKISRKLAYQPFGLKYLGEQIISVLNNKCSSLLIRNKTLDFSKHYIMGILNVTPDSFSDGGMFFDLDKAVDYFKKLVSDGADVVDIGGESTRPGFTSVLVEEEANRVLPLVRAIRLFDNTTIISIDTRNAKTAELSLQAGADIINDVSGLEWDSDMLRIIKEYNCPIVINHSVSTPDCDIVDEIYEFFKRKISYLLENGINKDKIILDVGICFEKSIEQNFEIINRIKEFKSLNMPLMVGHSRKSFLKCKLNTDDNDILDDATLVMSKKLFENGVNIVRVHNVKKHSILKQI